MPPRERSPELADMEEALAVCSEELDCALYALAADIKKGNIPNQEKCESCGNQPSAVSHGDLFSPRAVLVDPSESSVRNRCNLLEIIDKQD